MLIISIETAANHKTLIFVAFGFYFEQHASIFRVNKSYARVICRHHDAIVCFGGTTAQEFDASDFSAFRKLSCPISAFYFQQVLQ